MKNIIGLAAIAALAACSQSATTPDAQASAGAAMEATSDAPSDASTSLAADGQSPVGKYKITAANGDVTMEELKADGTYTAMADGKVVESGTWDQKSPSEYCYTKSEPDATEVCNKEGIDAKGVWTSENPDTKESVTVERVPE
ncbi:hypothetical protein [Tsuneonella mangrovi]|uniref:hypothetical protein n=1 Tax=Tsuneonella mangrovi TaxID=1982042 RepID=UPI000BA251D2|nr:hypothetical protein [Tsuneonella mangrovi]